MTDKFFYYLNKEVYSEPRVGVIFIGVESHKFPNYPYDWYHALIPYQDDEWSYRAEDVCSAHMNADTLDNRISITEAEARVRVQSYQGSLFARLDGVKTAYERLRNELQVLCKRWPWVVLYE